MRTKAIIVDLDGTLCNNEHRRPLVENPGPKDWEKFGERLIDDTANEWCVKLVGAMALRGYYIAYVTGRSEQYRELTLRWLNRHGCLDTSKRVGLYMRAPDDNRDDTVVKSDIYACEIEPNYDVLFCVDDRQRVVDMWRSLGLTCLQCAKGDF